MDPNEIIKAAPEIAKGAAALGAAIPFTGIVKRMLGPAADEVAEMWRDRVRLYRYERQLKCVEKAEKMAKEAGFTPQAVPPKILFPLLEGASFEDDKDLHDMWASLLANAASSVTPSVVRPGFIAVLRQMAPDEAALLNCMYGEDPYHGWMLDEGTILERYAALGFGPLEVRNDFQGQFRESMSFLERFESCLANLQAAQLVSTASRSDDPQVAYFAHTIRGVGFLKACRPPKRKE
jgi:hypothetical protein